MPRVTTPSDAAFFDEEDSALDEEDIDIIKHISQLAQDCEVLTVRG